MKSVSALFRSVWAWLLVLLCLAVVSYLVFRVNLDEAGGVQATLIEMPPSNYVITTRGTIDIDGGLIRLSAGSTGVIEEVLVAEGERVTANQLLAIQDDREERLALQNAEIAYENARIQLERNELDLAISRRTAERGGMQRAQDAISQEAYQNMLDAVRRNELQLEQQRNDVAISAAAVERAKATLLRRELRAPVDGQVVKVNVAPGSGVSAQNVSTAILIKPDRDKVIRVGVSDRDLEQVFPGQVVDVTRLSGGESVYSGTVVHIAEVYSNVLDTQPAAPNAPAATIEVVINVGDIPLRLGQQVLVKFTRDGTAEAG